MISDRNCSNDCYFCNKHDHVDWCDYAVTILTKDKKFFISTVGCVSYIKRKNV